MHGNNAAASLPRFFIALAAIGREPPARRAAIDKKGFAYTLASRRPKRAGKSRGSKRAKARTEAESQGPKMKRKAKGKTNKRHDHKPRGKEKRERKENAGTPKHRRIKGDFHIKGNQTPKETAGDGGSLRKMKP